MRTFFLTFLAFATILFVTASVVPPLKAIVHVALCDPTCPTNGCSACCEQHGYQLGGLCVNVTSTTTWCYCN
ncbi:unnamed protein product, partial [Mesorhabditis belari]|uniref:Uncharacterized protein n=1 Tax=Mesorhabditis belari TaxID=2138241 RepID=A0AAF3FT32_9BILA